MQLAASLANGPASLSVRNFGGIRVALASLRDPADAREAALLSCAFSELELRHGQVRTAAKELPVTFLRSSLSELASVLSARAAVCSLLSGAPGAGRERKGAEGADTLSVFPVPSLSLPFPDLDAEAEKGNRAYKAQRRPRAGQQGPQFSPFYTDEAMELSLAPWHPGEGEGEEEEQRLQEERAERGEPAGQGTRVPPASPAGPFARFPSVLTPAPADLSGVQPGCSERSEPCQLALEDFCVSHAIRGPADLDAVILVALPPGLSEEAVRGDPTAFSEGVLEALPGFLAGAASLADTHPTIRGLLSGGIPVKVLCPVPRPAPQSLREAAKASGIYVDDGALMYACVTDVSTRMNAFFSRYVLQKQGPKDRVDWVFPARDAAPARTPLDVIFSLNSFTRRGILYLPSLSGNSRADNPLSAEWLSRGRAAKDLGALIMSENIKTPNEPEDVPLVYPAAFSTPAKKLHGRLLKAAGDYYLKIYDLESARRAYEAAQDRLEKSDLVWAAACTFALDVTRYLISSQRDAIAAREAQIKAIQDQGRQPASLFERKTVDPSALDVAKQAHRSALALCRLLAASGCVNSALRVLSTDLALARSLTDLPRISEYTRPGAPTPAASAAPLAISIHNALLAHSYELSLFAPSEEHSLLLHQFSASYREFSPRQAASLGFILVHGLIPALLAGPAAPAAKASAGVEGVGVAGVVEAANAGGAVESAEIAADAGTAEFPKSTGPAGADAPRSTGSVALQATIGSNLGLAATFLQSCLDANPFLRGLCGAPPFNRYPELLKHAGASAAAGGGRRLSCTVRGLEVQTEALLSQAEDRSVVCTVRNTVELSLPSSSGGVFLVRAGQQRDRVLVAGAPSTLLLSLREDLRALLGGLEPRHARLIVEVREIGTAGEQGEGARGSGTSGEAGAAGAAKEAEQPGPQDSFAPLAPGSQRLQLHVTAVECRKSKLFLEVLPLFQGPGLMEARLTGAYLDKAPSATELGRTLEFSEPLRFVIVPAVPLLCVESLSARSVVRAPGQEGGSDSESESEAEGEVDSGEEGAGPGAGGLEGSRNEKGDAPCPDSPLDPQAAALELERGASFAQNPGPHAPAATLGYLYNKIVVAHGMRLGDLCTLPDAPKFLLRGSSMVTVTLDGVLAPDGLFAISPGQNLRADVRLDLPKHTGYGFEAKYPGFSVKTRVFVFLRYKAPVLGAVAQTAPGAGGLPLGGVTCTIHAPRAPVTYCDDLLQRLCFSENEGEVTIGLRPGCSSLYFCYDRDNTAFAEGGKGRFGRLVAYRGADAPEGPAIDLSAARRAWGPLGARLEVQCSRNCVPLGTVPRFLRAAGTVRLAFLDSAPAWVRVRVTDGGRGGEGGESVGGNVSSGLGLGSGPGARSSSGSSPNANGTVLLDETLTF